MEVGDSYLVYVYLNSADGRITASSKVDKFLDDEAPHDFVPGQPRRGFVKFVRADGKIDLALKQEQETRDQHSMTVLNYLKAHDGFAAVHDKSDPAIMQKLFGMSKKTFKKTIGGLFRQRLITIGSDGIRLNKQADQSTTNTK
jgi:predicted RNA-binding protein (virulence factor B family)